MSQPPEPSSADLPARAPIRAHPERDRTDDAPAMLAAGYVAHVGFVDDGRPVVIPMTYHYAQAEPHRLYLHGNVSGRLMARLATGAPVCVAVTELDGLVYSRTALNHSVNYRSVVVFARAAGRAPSLEERERVLEAMIARYFPGRTAGRDYERASQAQLAATAVVALEIDGWSAKVREGGPNGPGDADPARRGTAGVVPMARAAGVPLGGGMRDAPGSPGDPGIT
jgi:nitroimidazol reductase NimA-like FMN-containing flavoprotein (pyridoxamine 5'-phosphate oxidase superfamily)